MAETQQPDVLKNLIWFLIGLAIIGILLALVIQFTGAVPVGPVAGHPPANPIY